MLNKVKSQLLERREHQRLQLMIAILFSIATVIIGLSKIAYIPLADTKFDVTVVAFVFATLIGGYAVGVPLAVVWSLSTWFNVSAHFLQWDLWQLVLTRVVFAIALVFFYNLARKIRERSPYNVYRAIVAGVLVKLVVSMPINIFLKGNIAGFKLTLEVAFLEMALCIVFMILIIKHLREIHILNGVRKKEKGEKKNGYKATIS